MNRLALSVVLSLSLTGVAYAADPIPASNPPTSSPAAPASAPATEHLQVTVTAVEGLVRYRVGSGKLTKCKVGQVLDEGAEFVTGPDSHVQFTLPPDQTITVDSLSNVKVIDAVKSNGKVTTDVGMKHGRVRLEINAAGVEHQSTIRSPNSTLAVSGTIVSLTDQRPFPPVASSLTGRARFATKKAKTSFGNKGAGKLTVTGDQPISAEQLLSSSVLDPSIALARTPEERQLLANVISLGGIVNFGNDRQIPIVTDLTPPTTDAGLRPFVVGQLDFILRWNSNANLDLTIGNQANEVIFPHTGGNTTPSGGVIPFDDQGGPHGGLELAYWKNTFPATVYAAYIDNVSGAPTTFTLDVFEHHQHLTADTFPSTPQTLAPGQSVIDFIDLTGSPSVAPLSQRSKPKAAVSHQAGSIIQAIVATPVISTASSLNGIAAHHR